MNKLYKIIIPMLMIIQYAGLGAIAQIIIILFIIIELLRGVKFYLSDYDKIFIYLFSLIFLLKSINVPLSVNILLFKFYWGFLIFYIFFKLSNYKINFLNLFWISCIISVIEGLLINTIIPIGILKNIPEKHIEIISQEITVNSFNRAYGLGSSPTVSATIIVALLSSIYQFEREKFKEYFILIAGIALFFLASGTGFFLFLIFVVFRYKLFKGYKFILGLTIITLIINYVLKRDINDGGVLMRLSANYFKVLYELKTIQFNEVITNISKTYNSLFLGLKYLHTSDARVMSDFGWIDFIECFGLTGILLFISFFIYKRISLTLTLSIVIIGCFHYPMIGSIPGQIIFAGIVIYNLNYKSKNHELQPNNDCYA